jgi:hypothetical protein
MYQRNTCKRISRSLKSLLLHLPTQHGPWIEAVFFWIPRIRNPRSTWDACGVSRFDSLLLKQLQLTSLMSHNWRNKRHSFLHRNLALRNRLPAFSCTSTLIKRRIPYSNCAWNCHAHQGHVEHIPSLHLNLSEPSLHKADERSPQIFCLDVS